MHRFGTILAFIANKLFAVVLIMFLFFGIPILGVLSFTTNSADVKQALVEANIYTTVPQNILSIVELESEDGEDRDSKTIRETLEENGVIDPDRLQELIANVLDAPFLQGQVEGLIDSVYGFLGGETEELSFTLSLQDRADVAATELRAFVTESLADIPVCTEEQAGNFKDLDILETDCRPPGDELEREVNKLIDEVTADDGVLGEVYTEDDLDVSSADFAGAKVAYAGAERAPFIFWVVILGMATAVALTAHSIHRGLKMVGIIFGVLGALLFIGFATINANVDVIDFAIEDAELSEAQQQAVEAIAEPLSSAVAGAVSSNIALSGMMLIIAGIASFVFGVVLTRHHVEHLQFHANNQANSHPSSAEESSVVVPKKATPTQQTNPPDTKPSKKLNQKKAPKK